MKKFYENPSVEKFSLTVQEQLMSGKVPSISENGFGFGDDGPQSNRDREE